MSINVKNENIEVVYFDQQIWSGLAKEEDRYINLRDYLQKNLPLKMIFPYSTVHIQELVEIGRLTSMSAENRQSNALPKLTFIKEIGSSIYIEVDGSYTNFTFTTRDPIEAFNTFTEVEIKSAAPHQFTDFIPKNIVREIQKMFEVGPRKLNEMTETEAVEKINLGIKKFMHKCSTNEVFHSEYLKEAKEQAAEFVKKCHNYSITALNESLEFSKEGLSKLNSECEKSMVLDLIQNTENQIEQLNSELDVNIQNAQENCEISFSSPQSEYTFEMMLELSQQQSKDLPRSINKTLLLDFFGYKSKLNKRRSDFFDALHKEYAKACDYFVTDDEKFQEKLGTIEDKIPGTNCLLLNSSSFLAKINNSID